MKKLLVVLVMLVGAVQIYLHADSDDVHGPVVVKKVTFTNQTGAISATTELTPLVDTSYIVTANLVVHGTGNTVVEPHLNYTDTSGFFFSPLRITTATSGTASDQMVFLTEQANGNVQVAVNYTAGSSSSTYDVTFTFIKL